MQFNSITFLIFFIVFYCFYRLLKGKSRNVYITFGSYLFYGFWNLPFVLLLLLSTGVDFFVGRKMFQEQNQKKRKYLLFLSLFSNLGVLFIFKYLGLFISTAYGIASFVGFNIEQPVINIILPVGISFYTFQTLSYTIDIYYRKFKPVDDIWVFAAFVSFFPQLVAGPILRAKEFVPQFFKNRSFRWQYFYQGLFLVVLGFFKKMVIADNLAPFVERVYNSNLNIYFLEAWVATYAYALQIYMDFSGYSDIAIGISLILGFYIPENFRSPYSAVSFSDFWKRWHISLSSWLRDYLYIPIGGNKKGEKRTYINLAITMLLGGLWHGAAWNFVAWGALHGVYLAIERFFGLNIVGKMKSEIFVRRIVVFHLVCITWVFFRASFKRGFVIIKNMVGVYDEPYVRLLSDYNIIVLLAVTIFVIAFHYYFSNLRIVAFAKKYRFSRLGIALFIAIMIISILTLKGTGGAFIYFQF